MARSALAVQSAVLAGLNPVFTAANVDGHSIINSGGDVIHYVKNGGGAPINVTCKTPAKVGGLDVAENIVAVPAGGERIIGPFQPSLFNQTGGVVHVDYSDVTSVTVAAVKVAL